MDKIRYSDVIRSTNRILQSAYPDITRYGNDTVDKAVPPYFFVECIPTSIQRQTQNMCHKGCTVMITYVQRIPDQVDNLEKVENIADTFGMNMEINNRNLLVLDYNHEYIGEQNNILQISFALDWWEDTHQESTEEMMEQLHTNVIAKGE